MIEVVAILQSEENTTLGIVLRIHAPDRQSRQSLRTKSPANLTILVSIAQEYPFEPYLPLHPAIRGEMETWNPFTIAMSTIQTIAS